MNNLTIAAEGIVALATLILLLCLFYGPWQAVCTEHCTELGRQAIFERRDRLFDMALSGRITFNSKIYKETRQSMNNMLRFTHTMTWQSIVIGAFFLKRTRPTLPEWHNVARSLPADVRKEIEQLVSECSAIMLLTAALKSFIIGPLVMMVCIGAAFTVGIRWILRRIVSQEKFEPLNQTIQATSAEFAENERRACAA
jgi:hypothetical protein